MWHAEVPLAGQPCRGARWVVSSPPPPTTAIRRARQCLPGTFHSSPCQCLSGPDFRSCHQGTHVLFLFWSPSGVPQACHPWEKVLQQPPPPGQSRGRQIRSWVLLCERGLIFIPSVQLDRRLLIRHVVRATVILSRDFLRLFSALPQLRCSMHHSGQGVHSGASRDCSHQRPSLWQAEPRLRTETHLHFNFFFLLRKRPVCEKLRPEGKLSRPASPREEAALPSWRPLRPHGCPRRHTRELPHSSGDPVFVTAALETLPDAWFWRLLFLSPQDRVYAFVEELLPEAEFPVSPRQVPTETPAAPIRMLTSLVTASPTGSPKNKIGCWPVKKAERRPRARAGLQDKVHRCDTSLSRSERWLLHLMHKTNPESPATWRNGGICSKWKATL